MHHTLIKLIELSESRINELEEDVKKDDSHYKDFYFWFETYYNWLIEELKEVKDELKPNNSVYLEDELWDVFWNYLCMLQSLQKWWYIKDVKKVLERCYKKLNERIKTVRETDSRDMWQVVKKKQKKELFEEHNCLYGCEE